MSESTAKPSDIILKFLEEILESWKGKRYQKVAEQCVALLKRRKTIENLGMTVPLQRILLQAYIHQNQYEKVLEWRKTGSPSSATSSTVKPREGCEDLVLYARYRTGDYSSVSKQSAVAASENNDDLVSCTVFHNLQAQSEFHLNNTEEGLAVYLQLLSNDSIDDNDLESKMEVLTNALALIASSGCTPMVSLNDDDEDLQFWLEEAEAMLLRDDEAVDSMFSDLASNLGCIRFLTNPIKATANGTDENWLEEAADTGEDDGAKKGTLEQSNLQWSKHFWYKDIEDVHYDELAQTKSDANNTNKLSVTESIIKANNALLNDNLNRLPPQPHPKWNLLQVRMYWYNRALLQLKAGKYVECHDSCQSLKKTLSDTGSSQSGSKKKKKSKDAMTTGNSTPMSPTTLWWEARADVILSYAQQAQSKFKDALTRLSERLVVLQASSPTLVLDHAIAHVLLHRFVMEQQQLEKGSKKDRQRQQHDLLTLLKSLPQSIRSNPAARLTIDDIQSAVDNDDSNNKTKNSPKSPLEEADVLFGEGRYIEACKVYENALSSCDDSSSTVIDSRLRYVQALAMSGEHKASEDLWRSLESNLPEHNTSSAGSHLDGDVLENKALPRSTTGSTRATITKKIVATTNEHDEDTSDKPSREKVLRRRAVKREAYLKELESKGKYNPDRPTKPNPERWIPKHERSRSSRGGNRGGAHRGGRNNNKGFNSAQGGGSKMDAERLDAAARRAGKAPASSGPSSANLKVSSGGRKGGRRR